MDHAGGPRLPDGWPPFALPAGASMLADESVDGVRRVAFSAADSDGTAAFFRERLARLGWAVRTMAPEAAGEVDLEIEGHGFWGQIEIDADGFRVQIVD